MDWMAQGTRITSNLCYDNSTDDLLMEVDHGPFVVDNNLFLSGVSLLDRSEGGAYAHNLLTGKIISRPELSRFTPYHQAHSTALGGLSNIKGGDDRFYNNILVGDVEAPTRAQARDANPQRATGFGLWVYDTGEFPLQTEGNVYYAGARPHSKEANPLTLPGFNPKPAIVEEGDSVYLHLALGQEVQKAATTRVTTSLLGKARVSGLAYENADGAPVVIDSDYFGKKRKEANPCAGPFENPGQGDLKLKVW